MFEIFTSLADLVTYSALGLSSETATVLETLAKDLYIDVQIENVTNTDEIMQYGVMSTPRVVVDDSFPHAGNVPSKKQAKAMLTP